MNNEQEKILATPWMLYSKHRDEMYFDIPINDEENRNLFRVEFNKDIDDETATAIGERIHRAVNSHDNLVTLLTDIAHKWHERHEGQFRWCQDVWCVDHRKAIDEAEGK